MTWLESVTRMERFAPLGGVDESPLRTRVFPQALHGRRRGADNAYNPARQHIVSETDIDESFARHDLFQILDLLAAFFQFILEVYNKAR